MNRRDLLATAAFLPFADPSRQPLQGGGLPPAPKTEEPEELYWHELRWHFHLPRETAYCNTATLGASPKSVTNAVADHLRYVEEDVVRCDYSLEHPEYLAGYRSERTLRDRVARHLGCDGDELALTRNATAGISYVAQGLDLAPGDEVVLTDQEHPGGRSSWDVRSKRHGIVVKEVKLPRPANDPDAIVRLYQQILTPKTKVLAIPHVTSAFGTVLPVARLTRLGKEHGCFVAIDGAQAFGQIPVDVHALGCDAYSASPHKWLLAPKGTGVFYLRRESASRVWNTIASGQWNNQTDHGWRLGQVGTGNQSMLHGFDAALDFIERIGLARIHKRIKDLGDHLRAGLATIPGVEIHSSTHPEMCAGITTWSIKGVESRPLANQLWDLTRVRLRAVGQEGLRQSVHIYCTKEDLDRSLKGTRQLAGA
jgi:isopenicillin-N epimerase